MSAPPVTPETAPPFLDVRSSACGKLWQRRQVDERDVATMVQREGLPPSVAEVLSGRGIKPEQADAFLTPTLRQHLPDPYVMRDMELAASTIADAIVAGKTIGVFGDYDVDGTTSCAILARFFTALAIPFHVHLPDRQEEGYGPNLPALKGLGEKGCSLILTVDCGATAHGVLGEAASEGLSVIVLDHHLMTLPAPQAVAVVNPNRPDDDSGLSMLSAGGVTFMTLVAVNRLLRERGMYKDRPAPDLMALLDLVALSLVCDVMPLKGLTRVLVRQGLGVISSFGPSGAGTPGIQALATMAGVSGVPRAHHFGFAVGPRINAAGRVGHARMAYELLASDDQATVDQLADELHSLNGARQHVEQQVLEDAITQGEARGGREADGPLIVAGDGWHQGVIGIVAGRLKERFDRPTLVISFDGDEGKGSGRSIGGVDLGEAISAAAEAGVIMGGGGHPMAAGLSVTRDQLPGLEQFLTERLAQDVSDARANATYWLDGLVGLAGINRTFQTALEAAGPFGNGNPEPRFAVTDVAIRHLKILKEKHIACTLVDRMGKTARGIAFGCVGDRLGDFLEAAQDGRRVHLAGRIKADDFRGGDAAQLHLEDGANLA